MKIGAIFMALTFTVFGNWFTDLFDSTPTPTIKIPVDLTKTGTIVDTTFRVNYKESTRFVLDFECTDVKLDGGKDCRERDKFIGLNAYWNDKKVNKVDYERAKRMLGDLIDKNYDFDGTRVPIKITLSQILADGSQVNILDKIYDTKATYERGDSRKITVKHLQRGKYHLKVENLKAFDELKGRPVKFRIQSTYRK